MDGWIPSVDSHIPYSVVTNTDIYVQYFLQWHMLHLSNTCHYPNPALNLKLTWLSQSCIFRIHAKLTSNVQRPPSNIKVCDYLKKYISNTVRYSRTAAVTECSEWTADNTGRPSACCLYTHTHTLPKTHAHIQTCRLAHTHSLYQSQGFCQWMCQHYQSYFSPTHYSAGHR